VRRKPLNFSENTGPKPLSCRRRLSILKETQRGKGWAPSPAADFRQIHPGGKLGARLRRVRDLMHAGDAMPLASPDLPMATALLRMTEKRFGCLGIVDDAGIRSVAGIPADRSDVQAAVRESAFRPDGEENRSVTCHPDATLSAAKGSGGAALMSRSSHQNKKQVLP